MAGACALGLLLTDPSLARGADLQDSATLVAHPAADINDVYLFPSPANAANVVLVMNVAPRIPAGQSGSMSFDSNVLYQFKLVHRSAPATSGSTTPEDTVIQFIVNGSGSSEHLALYGPTQPNLSGTVSTAVPAALSPTTIPFNQSTTVTIPDDASGGTRTWQGQVFAGPRADPSFFDLARFYAIFPDRYYMNQQNGQGIPAATATGFRGFASGNGSSCDSSVAHDFFSSGGLDLVTAPAGGYNTLSIVLELPKALLEQVPGTTTSQPYISLWATTSTVSGT